MISALLTILVYYPSFNGEFLNWDDNVYITSNPLVTGPILENIPTIFSTTFEGHYHPLVLISLSVDYHLSGGSPWFFHLINMLLHAINTLMVFLLILWITGRRFPAMAVAVLFCIHPVQVEAVAWITARKDVLFSFFFLLSLISWWQYSEKHQRKYYYAALVLFVLSCLSKGQAVVLPVVLLLMDYHRDGTFRWKMLIDKIPFLIISAFFTWMIIYAQSLTGYTSEIRPGFTDTVLYASYALMTYIQKLLIPTGLSAYYPYPYDAAGNAPGYLWWYFAATILFLILIIVSLRRFRLAAFALLFYFFNIIMMLKFIPVANFIVAERYAYLASIGIFLLMAHLAEIILQRLKTYRTAVMVLFLLAAAALAFAANRRTLVWKDSLSLLNGILSQHSDVTTALNSRGDLYAESGNFDEALRDFSRAIEIQPDMERAYRNRGLVYLKTGRFENAINDFSTSLQLSPGDPLSLLSRGLAYEGAGEAKKALADYNEAIVQDPALAQAWNNRGILRLKSGEVESAINDLGRAIALDPQNWQSHFNRGLAYLKDKQYYQAINDFNTCIGNGFRHPAVYLQRGIARMGIGNPRAAIEDFNQVVKLAPDDPAAYEQLGRLFFGQDEFARAAEYFDYSLRLGGSDASLYHYRGLSLLFSGQHERGCADLKAAVMLGYEKSKEALDEYCDK